MPRRSDRSVGRGLAKHTSSPTSTARDPLQIGCGKVCLELAPAHAVLRLPIFFYRVLNHLVGRDWPEFPATALVSGPAKRHLGGKRGECVST